MVQAAVAAGPYADRRARTRDLGARYPFARELLDFYGALLGAQEQAHGEAASAQPGATDLIAYVAESVVPAVVEVTVAAGPQKLRELVADRFNSADPREVVAAWVGGDEQDPIDRYLAGASVSPVLEALGAEVASSCIGPRDERHCLSCGGLPQLSYFAVASEDLAAGSRFLLCSRCHSAWGYARMTCPCCGEDASSRLPIFNEEGNASGERGSVVRGLEVRPKNLGERFGDPGGPDPGEATSSAASALSIRERAAQELSPEMGRMGAEDPSRAFPAAPQGRVGDHRKDSKAVFPHIRIEACESCRHYLLNIDLLADPAAIPIVDELAALPLDLYAREHGFKKVTPNLMGF